MFNSKKIVTNILKDKSKSRARHKSYHDLTDVQARQIFRLYKKERMEPGRIAYKVKATPIQVMDALEDKEWQKMFEE